MAICVKSVYISNLIYKAMYKVKFQIINQSKL